MFAWQRRHVHWSLTHIPRNSVFLLPNLETRMKTRLALFRRKKKSNISYSRSFTGDINIHLTDEMLLFLMNDTIQSRTLVDHIRLKLIRDERNKLMDQGRCESSTNPSSSLIIGPSFSDTCQENEVLH